MNSENTNTAQQNSPHSYYHEDEITLKELILKIQEYWGVLWNKKGWIIGAGIVMGLIFATRAYHQAPVYPAEITFMVNEDNGGGGMAGAAAILGQFGLGGANSEYNLDKIIALAKSNKIISAALLDTSYQPLLADQLIDVYGYKEKWSENELLSDFESFVSSNQNSLARNTAMNSLVRLIRGGEDTEGIATLGYTEETGILNIKVKSRQPELSIALTETIYKHLSNFYINETIERPQKNYQLLVERADSVVQQLAIVEQRIARYQDASRGILLKVDEIALNKLKRTAQILAVMYAEVIKNRETANFILKTETPFFQIIDQSELPISAVSKGLMKQLVIGGFLGAFLLSLFFIVKKIYRQAMMN